MARLSLVTVKRFTQCPACERVYRVDDKTFRLVGETFICRCGEFFDLQVLSLAPALQKHACKFNLPLKRECEEVLERAGSPGGLLESEVFAALLTHRVRSTIADAIVAQTGRHVSPEDIRDFLEEWREHGTEVE